MRIVIAGGGTGGHIFPAIALAEEIIGRDPASEVVLVGADRPLDRGIIGMTPFQHRFLPATPLAGLPALKKAVNLAILSGIIASAAASLRKLPGHCVLATGGYASFPMAAAAFILRRRVYLQEQNSIPGIANRITARWAKRIFLGFPDASRWFPAGATIFTGNPIRRGLEEQLAAYSPPPPGSATILVIGGSQGSRSIDGLVVDALRRDPAAFAGLKFIHQAGKANQEAVREAYREAGVEATVSGFFHDMGRIYRTCHLAVARAGALTVAELVAASLPAVLIPLPHAARDHQTANARRIADSGGAVLLPERDAADGALGGVIAGILSDPARLSSMSAAMGGALPRDGRKVIVDTLFALEMR